LSKKIQRGKLYRGAFRGSKYSIPRKTIPLFGKINSKKLTGIYQFF